MILALGYLHLGYEEGKPLPEIGHWELHPKNTFVHFPKDGTEPFPHLIVGDFGMASYSDDKIWQLGGCFKDNPNGPAQH